MRSLELFIIQNIEDMILGILEVRKLPKACRCAFIGSF